MEAELAKELDREAQAAQRQGEDLVDGGGSQALLSTQSEVLDAPVKCTSAAQRCKQFPLLSTVLVLIS